MLFQLFLSCPLFLTGNWPCLLTRSCYRLSRVIDSVSQWKEVMDLGAEVMKILIWLPINCDADIQQLILCNIQVCPCINEPGDQSLTSAQSISSCQIHVNCLDHAHHMVYKDSPQSISSGLARIREAKPNRSLGAIGTNGSFFGLSAGGKTHS